MNDPNIRVTRQGADLQQLLKAQSHGVFTRSRIVIAGVLILVLAVAGWMWFLSGNEASAPRYATEPATVGSLVVRVSATGNLQPTNQVDVGSELSGIVTQVFVDDNDRVKKGQVLARLDISRLKDAVEKSRANLSAAEAQVLQAQATVAESQATLTRYRQVAKLSGGKVPSKSEIDVAEANLKRATATEVSARASVAQARATLRSDETNLSKADIRSPIDGIVLSREVSPGQTVAASFQAPVLFKLAEDLRKMELHVNVDEADVGRVEPGQQATFTVDAWPGREYAAVIRRVGYGAQEKEGVISYLTVLDVNNDDLSLRPGMTGTAEITTLTHDNVLLVPNAALRFTPQTTATAKRKSGGNVLGTLFPRRPQPTKAVRVENVKGSARVWELRGTEAVPIDVKTGATNGKVTEITGGDLEAGTQLITETLSTR